MELEMPVFSKSISALIGTSDRKCVCHRTEVKCHRLHKSVVVERLSSYKSIFPE